MQTVAGTMRTMYLILSPESFAPTLRQVLCPLSHEETDIQGEWSYRLSTLERLVKEQVWGEDQKLHCVHAKFEMCVQP